MEISSFLFFDSPISNNIEFVGTERAWEKKREMQVSKISTMEARVRASNKQRSYAANVNAANFCVCELLFPRISIYGFNIERM